MENIIQKIREIYPVSDEALQALQANMELRYYPKDTYIVQSGVTDRLVYFIEEGIARSVFHHNGQDTTTWFTLEGDITFGMDSLYYQQPSVESIETLSDCKIYVIHIDKLNALYETYIDIANWGRILCALGYSGAQFDPEHMELYYAAGDRKILIYKDGGDAGYSEEEASDILSQKEVQILADMKMGEAEATAWGCDLTYDYVKINADYRS